MRSPFAGQVPAGVLPRGMGEPGSRRYPDAGRRRRVVGGGGGGWSPPSARAARRWGRLVGAPGGPGRRPSRRAGPLWAEAARPEASGWWRGWSTATTWDVGRRGQGQPAAQAGHRPGGRPERTPRARRGPACGSRNARAGVCASGPRLRRFWWLALPALSRRPGHRRHGEPGGGRSHPGQPEHRGGPRWSASRRGRPGSRWSSPARGLAGRAGQRWPPFARPPWPAEPRVCPDLVVGRPPDPRHRALRACPRALHEAAHIAGRRHDPPAPPPGGPPPRAPGTADPRGVPGLLWSLRQDPRLATFTEAHPAARCSTHRRAADLGLLDLLRAYLAVDGNTAELARPAAT